MKRVLLTDGSRLATALAVSEIKNLDYIYLVNVGQANLDEQYANLVSTVAKLSMPYPLVNYEILKCVDLDKAKLLGVLAVAIDHAIEKWGENVEFIMPICQDHMYRDNFINLATVVHILTDNTVTLRFPFLDRNLTAEDAIELAHSKLNNYLADGCYGATPDVLDI